MKNAQFFLKTILNLLFILLPLIGNAQTQKGTWSIGISTGNNFKTDNHRWSVLPNAGYFVANNVCLGVEMSYAHTSTNYANYASNNNPSYSNQKEYGIAPFARYYFFNGKIKPFLQGAFLFNNATLSAENSASKSTSFSTFVPSAGFAYFINTHASIDVRADFSTNNKFNNSGLKLGVQFFISSK